jgi:hypothetical protein
MTHPLHSSTKCFTTLLILSSFPQKHRAKPCYASLYGRRKNRADARHAACRLGEAAAPLPLSPPSLLLYSSLNMET